MGKSLFIAEKPSVAMEFAKALKVNTTRKDGYLEGENCIVTWCVGHLVTMSYPEKYDEKYKKWSFSTLPFLPTEFKYEVIPAVKKQFEIVKKLLHRKDLDVIYVCTDSGREGEYIYRLVAKMAKVGNTPQKRVWIDSQTEEEILRGIKEAKDISFYNNLSDSAFLRAKEDYLMGINFSRALSIKYGNCLSSYLNKKYQSIAVGRVMTCVMGMVVKREREIREFRKQTFYKINSTFSLNNLIYEGEWRVNERSKYFNSPFLYKDSGFIKKDKAEEFINYQKETKPFNGEITEVSKKKEKKNPPLLFNLAELQNVCSKLFKINPAETLNIVQELYEKKLVTYPRTDARVLSSAIAKVISKNISGLKAYSPLSEYANEILQNKSYLGLEKSKYVNDSQITDHYSIIPTGSGLKELYKISPLHQKIYMVIVRRFLSIFYPPAQYAKVQITTKIGEDFYYTNDKTLIDQGYLKVANINNEEQKEGDRSISPELIKTMKKGLKVNINEIKMKVGETSPPKRYNSGNIILAMENAGSFIEDEELRAQIKGSGIGTSATRAEILKKLFNIKYLSLNKKTQIITPTLLGEMIVNVVSCSMPALLNPTLTASWEKGLNLVASGDITSKDYMEKLERFVREKTNGVEDTNYVAGLRKSFANVENYYKK